MIPEIGHFALILALLLALCGGLLPMLGAQLRIEPFMRIATPAACGQFGFVLLACACLGRAFLSNDFSVIYVLQNSHSALPLIYRIAAVWSGHEGPLLLWVSLLALWMPAFSVLSRRLSLAVRARALSVMSLIQAGFLLFLLLTSDPFERILPPSMDGRGLNPLLQALGMVMQPPLLFMGYTGFSVSFALAIAVLLSDEPDPAWARTARAWTLAAWAFLTLGIMLGSNRTYYELGRGEWWSWDPIENASLMLWLAGTALIHSLAVTVKRGAFGAWSVLLAICAFALSLLGTLMVHSSVDTSMDGFTADAARRMLIFAMLVLFAGGGLLLLAWRARRLASKIAFGILSRETLLLANNLLMLMAAASVMLHTLYPMALVRDKLSFGASWFDSVFVPLITLALFLMGIAPLAQWKSASLRDLAMRLRNAAVMSVASALLLGGFRPLVMLGVLLAFWVLASVATSMGERCASKQITRAVVGMWIAHAGVGVFIIGVTLSMGFSIEREVRLAHGESIDVAEYRFRLDTVHDVDGPNYRATRAAIYVSSEGSEVAMLFPEKRTFAASGTQTTEAAIDHGVLRDLYVAMDAPAGRDAWTLRIQIKPFVQWIWAGCVLMALGGAVAATDRRHRRVRVRVRMHAAALTRRAVIPETGR
jgi:cytochrome c-type biogenesis protein CcmF